MTRPSFSTVTRSAEREDLGQPVRDVDDRDAVRPRAGARSSKRRSVSVSVSAAVGSSRIRSSRSLRQRLGDLDHLRLRRRQRRAPAAPDRARRPSRARSRRVAARIRLRSTAPKRAASAAVRRRCSRRPSSCGTSEPSWCTMPMPSAPAAASSMSPSGAPSSSIAPASALVDAADDLAERRLAGAVLAEQRPDLAGHDRQRDAVERLHPGKDLLQSTTRRRGIAGAELKRASVMGLRLRRPAAARPANKDRRRSRDAPPWRPAPRMRHVRR